jgi:alpha-ketoglutaric semialdehyde dehydrogenase
VSALAVRQQGLYSGGEWRLTGSAYECRNPARPWEITGRYSVALADDVSQAYDAASTAAVAWGTRPAGERAEILFRAGELVAARSGELAAAQVAEAGTPLADARSEADRASAILRYVAGECAQLVGDVYSSRASRFVYTQRVPVGVVCAITSRSFPLAIPIWKIGSALAYGNAVVWKPSELTTQCAIDLMGVLIEAGIPPGVLNLITGPGPRISESLVSGPGLAAVSFTGTNRVGQQLQSVLNGSNIRMDLDVAAKHSALVLADADLELAALEIANGAMRRAGQRHSGTGRVVVDQRVVAGLLDRLVAAVSVLRVGDPAQIETDIGPLSSRAQFDAVLGHLDHARALGLELVCGGRATDPDRGFFVDPTVVLDRSGESPLSRGEVFGPVLTVTLVEDTGAALDVASRTFQRSVSVYTRSLERARTFVHEVNAGVVHVNGEPQPGEPHVPFAGMNPASSSLRVQGKAAREFLTDLKTVHVHG